MSMLVNLFSQIKIHKIKFRLKTIVPTNFGLEVGNVLLHQTLINTLQSAVWKYLSIVLLFFFIVGELLRI